MMKKTVFLLVLSLGVLASNTWAERGGEGKGKHKGGDHFARMQEHLGLSDDQVSQMREIRANGGSREEVRGVLTDSQAEQLRQHREARRAEGGGRGKGKGRGKGHGNTESVTEPTAE